MSAKHVIVTGAGAPAAEGAPIQSKLLQRFWETEQSDLREARLFRRANPDPGVPWPNPWFEVLFDLDLYFKKFFGIDVGREPTSAGSGKEFEFPTFEEALGMLDLALFNQEDFPDFQEHPYHAAIGMTRYHLIALIASGLSKAVPDIGKHHLRLVESLRKIGRLQQTAFVTLNYDMLLDKALERTVGPENVDYVVQFRSQGNHIATRITDGIPLVKVHGSLDWLYCACCRTLDRDDVRRVIPGLFEGTPFCSCGNVKRPMIVAPSFVKSFSNLALQKLWATAEEFIGAAERIVFCGYSLPDADLNFKYLIKRAQLRSQGRKEVIVINSHQHKADSDKKQEADRYKRFFGTDISLAYTNYSFEEFAYDPTIADAARN